MVHGKNRIPYWIDRRLTGLVGPEYHAIISFGLPIEPEDSQYGKYRYPDDAELPVLSRLLICCPRRGWHWAALAGLFHKALSYGVIEPAARANSQNPRPS